MAERIAGRARELLEEKNFAHVATLRKDGSILVNPVWVDTDGEHVVLNSAEGRAWPNNLRRDPRVSMSVANQENPYEHVTVRGRVVEDTHAGADEHINAMAKKYLGEDEYPFRAPGEQRILIRVEPEEVHHYGG